MHFTHARARAHTHTNTHTHIHTCTHTHTHAHTYTCTHTCTHTCTLHTHAHTHTCTHTYTHDTCTYMYMEVYLYNIGPTPCCYLHVSCHMSIVLTSIQMHACNVLCMRVTLTPARVSVHIRYLYPILRLS